MSEDNKKDAVEFTEDQLSEIIAKKLDEKLNTIDDKLNSFADRLVAEEKKEPDPIKVDAEAFNPEDKAFQERMKQAEANSPHNMVPKDEFSFVRFIEAQTTHDWTNAKYEEWALKETRKKAITWASGSGGGYWVAEQFLPERFIEELHAMIVCIKAGCLVLPCKNAPVKIPAISAGGTAYWPGQNAAITESSATPAQVTLTPHPCTARTFISRTLAYTSEGAAEAFVRNELARRIGLAVDKAMINGSVATATPDSPTGMANFSSKQTYVIGTNGGAMTPTGLFTMLYNLEAANVPLDGICWVMHPRTWNGIRQFTRGLTGEGGFASRDYLWAADPAVGEPRSILGYPVFTSTQCRINLTKGSGTNLAELFCVNMKEIILAEWGGVEIEATTEGGNAWANHGVEIKAVYQTDVGGRHENAVCVCAESTT